MQDKFIIITWPEIQDYMDKPKFKENSCLINEEPFFSEYGSSAYFVREFWIGEADKQIELKDYTTEELKAEIKRRAEIARAQKAEEMKNALRCRNCKYCVAHPKLPWYKHKICMARTWRKKNPRHKTVNHTKTACDKFERKKKKKVNHD